MIRLATTFACCLVLGACASFSPASPQPAIDGSSDRSADGCGRVQRLMLYVGQRRLDEQDYGSVDRQPTLAIEYANESPRQRLDWEAALLVSHDEEGNAADGTTREISYGIRRSFGQGRARPYVGGGVAYIDSELDTAGASSDRDGDFAGYFHVGFAMHVTSALVLGLDTRVLHGSRLRLAGVDTDADYAQIALGIGFEF